MEMKFDGLNGFHRDSPTCRWPTHSPKVPLFVKHGEKWVPTCDFCPFWAILGLWAEFGGQKMLELGSIEPNPFTNLPG